MKRPQQPLFTEPKPAQPIPSHLYELNGQVWEVFDGGQELIRYRVDWKPVRPVGEAS